MLNASSMAFKRIDMQIVITKIKLHHPEFHYDLQVRYENLRSQYSIQLSVVLLFYMLFW